MLNRLRIGPLEKFNRSAFITASVISSSTSNRSCDPISLSYRSDHTGEPAAALTSWAVILSRLFDLRKVKQAEVRVDGTLKSGEHTGSIHKIGAILEGQPACNGWTYWHFESGKGLIPIDDLRTMARRQLCLAAE